MMELQVHVERASNMYPMSGAFARMLCNKHPMMLICAQPLSDKYLMNDNLFRMFRN